MDTKFEIQSDFEFYCYLKAHLPVGYRVVAQPHQSYFSEWHYRYQIYHKDRLFREYRGTFKEMEKGSLVKEAKKILESIGE